MVSAAIPAFSDVPGALLRPYNEPAFRYFLTIERKRADQWSRSLALVLVNSRNPSGVPGTGVLSPRTSAKVFSALAASVRDADFIGWYREGLVAAAALPLRHGQPGEMRKHLTERVTRGLEQRMAKDAGLLRIRVVELRGRPRG